MTIHADTKTMPVPALRRSNILNYAAHLIHPDERDPAAVLEAAGPLLAWAADADSETDQRARAIAMSHADANAPSYRRNPRTGAETPARPTPEEFLDAARSYYRFLTAA